jgi:hypothetical protein
MRGCIVVEQLVATSTFTAEQEGDLSFARGDEFEWVGEGLDPSFVQVRTLAAPHAVGQVPASFVREVGVISRESHIPAFDVARHVNALINSQQLPAG